MPVLHARGSASATTTATAARMRFGKVCGSEVMLFTRVMQVFCGRGLIELGLRQVWVEKSTEAGAVGVVLVAS